MTDVTRESLAAALREIRDICDTDRDDLREKYGSEFRAYMAVIPSIVDRALPALAALPSPAPEPHEDSPHAEVAAHVLGATWHEHPIDDGHGHHFVWKHRHETAPGRAAQPAPDPEAIRLLQLALETWLPPTSTTIATIAEHTAAMREIDEFLQARESGGEAR